MTRPFLSTAHDTFDCIRIEIERMSDHIPDGRIFSQNVWRDIDPFLAQKKKSTVVGQRNENLYEGYQFGIPRESRMDDEGRVLYVSPILGTNI